MKHQRQIKGPTNGDETETLLCKDTCYVRFYRLDCPNVGGLANLTHEEAKASNR